MSLLLLNFVLALGWGAVWGSFAPGSLLLGFLVGYAALRVTRPLYGPTRYFERAGRIVRLAGFFLVELVKSNARVAWEVLTPVTYSRPGVVAVPLEVESDLEILLLTDLITLTPGTLSLDLSEDRRTLYVHAMFIDDVEALRRELKDGMERRVLEVTR